MSRAPARQDTFDLRHQIVTDDDSHLGQGLEHYSDDEEQHSMIEEDSDIDDREEQYVDDDRSSSLSIPNESIDFDLVYSLHSFAATVEGQASVVKGDSLVLMDDSNSYWWLVRVLKTQEIGYIPAENIETPFERLARLNKHRNVDLASATQAEMQSGLQESRERFMSSRTGHTPSPTSGADLNTSRLAKTRSVVFNHHMHFSRYPPAVWHEEDEDEEEDDDEWDVGEYTQERASFAGDAELERPMDVDGDDDGMSWKDPMPDAQRAREAAAGAQAAIAEEQRQLELQAQHRHQQQQQLELEQQQREAEYQAQQQRAQIEEQRRLAQQQEHEVRRTESRERMLGQESTSTSSLASGSPRSLDPAAAVETRKISVTPSIVQDGAGSPSGKTGTGPLLPSDVMRRQEEERKRTREEIEALEAAGKRARGQAVVSSVSSPVPGQGANPVRGGAPGKLTKERPSAVSDDDSGKKSKSGLFGGLFGRRKDKHKDKGSSGSISDSGHGGIGDALLRPSEDSSRSGSASVQHDSVRSGTSPAPPGIGVSVGLGGAGGAGVGGGPGGLQSAQSPASVHAQQLRIRDKEQQALYQQYLNRSPASPPEIQPTLGQPGAGALAGSISFGSVSSSTSASALQIPGQGPGGEGQRRARPGSLVLSPTGTGVDVPVPELSVIRVFAGKRLQTEATFKTVLLNAHTSAGDLVRQAMQRFRLPAGEDARDYFLTVKQVEGASAALRPEEHPLRVFETLVEAAMELPKVKRSSVGSISSIASNLSMHPAIKRLPMNDFTDDSAVKFYLNRRGAEGPDDGAGGPEEGDSTMIAESVPDEDELGSQTLAVPGSMLADRLTSPSFRFALRLVIYPDDLPDDMVFDPVTEAIVFKHTLRERAHQTPAQGSGVSQQFRRKVFVFPKNITVAEVIEIGLERFGISEGVVDGGDEVEDKMTKRRSASRVRYVLHSSIDGKERELPMSTRIIEAYPVPPAPRPAARFDKRRSADSMQILGAAEDVAPTDPVFVLRRATTYRASAGRHRVSAPLDEIGLKKLHRESASSQSSSIADGIQQQGQRQMSKQELIAAQREAQRASQRAIISAQTNSVRGVDVLLPGNAVLRSARAGSDGGVRYSYVQPDGESLDVSDIVEDVLRSDAPGGNGDLLRGQLDGARLDAVLSKIRDKDATGQATLDAIAGFYSGEEDEDGDGEDDRSGALTPPAALLNARNTAHQRTGSLTGAVRTMSPVGGSGSRTTTPVQYAGRPSAEFTRAQSAASAFSDVTFRTAVGSPMHSTLALASGRQTSTPTPKRRPVPLPKDDFGVAHMMAIIELAGTRGREPPLEKMHPVDEMLFGRAAFDVGSLHPIVRDIYAPSFKQLDEMDKALDDLLQMSTATSKT